MIAVAQNARHRNYLLDALKIELVILLFGPCELVWSFGFFLPVPFQGESDPTHRRR